MIVESLDKVKNMKPPLCTKLIAHNRSGRGGRWTYLGFQGSCVQIHSAHHCEHGVTGTHLQSTAPLCRRECCRVLVKAACISSVHGYSEGLQWGADKGLGRAGQNTHTLLPKAAKLSLRPLGSSRVRKVKCSNSFLK